MSSKPQVLFKDRRFTVTTADIKTPSLYYPISDTVGRVRKDIQFAALGLCALLGAALTLYWDLWFVHEKAAIGAVIVLAVIIAVSLSVMQIDARGFPSRLFIARRGTIRKLFEAIAMARAQSASSVGYGANEDQGED